MVRPVILKGMFVMKCLMTVLVAAVSLAAFAQEPAAEGAARPRSGRAAMGGGQSIEPVLRAAMNPKIAEKAAITEEQVEKLKALAGEKDTLKALHEKVRKGTERRVELLKAEKIDEAAVMAAIDGAWDAKKEVAKFQTKRLIAVKSILSAEQIEKIRDALKAKRDGRQKGARGEGKGRRRGKTVEIPSET